MKLIRKEIQILAYVLLANSVSAQDQVKPRHRFVGGCLEEVAGLFKTEEGGCKHIPEQIVWAAPFAKPMTHASAHRDCESLDNGWDDWRLPWPRELEKIAGSDFAPRMIKRLGSGYYWTKDESNSKEALALDPNLESEGEMLEKTETARTICVREGYVAKPGEGCAENNENFWTSTGGCRDLNSKLTWSKVFDRELKIPTTSSFRRNRDEFERAVRNTCGSHVQGGYKDWRIPDWSEFGTIKRVKGLDLGPNPDRYLYSSTVSYQSSFNIYTGENDLGTSVEDFRKSFICVRGYWETTE